MKFKLHALIGAAVCSLFSISNFASAQGTAFAYQGQLSNLGNPATGDFDFTFTLYGTETLGAPLAGPVTNAAMGVTNGLFTAVIDLGAGRFTGGARWLEIGVRPTGTTGAFTVLTPREALTATPYALYALSPGGPQGPAGTNGAKGAVGPQGLIGLTGPAGVKGAVGPAGPAGAKGAGGPQGVAGPIGPIGVKGAVGPKGPPGPAGVAGPAGPVGAKGPTGVAGTVGPAGKQGPPGIQGIQGVPGPGGSASNAWSLNGNSSTHAPTNFLGTTDNQAMEIHVNGQRAIRFEPSTASNSPNVVIGSLFNAVSAGIGSSIGGGVSNNIAAGDGGGTFYSVIGGGNSNQILGDSQMLTIGGGGYNEIDQDSIGSFIGGGLSNHLAYGDDQSFIGAGRSNLVIFGAAVAIVGGAVNSIGDLFSPSRGAFIGAGLSNSIYGNAQASVIAGGEINIIGESAVDSVIAGGISNSVESANFGEDFTSATIGGGQKNQALGNYSTIPGGLGNVARGVASFAAGSGAHAVRDHTFVWSDGSQSFAEDSASNQFIIYSQNGVGINTDEPPTNGLGVFGDIISHGNVIANEALHARGTIMSDYNITAGGNVASQTLTVTNTVSCASIAIVDLASANVIQASNVYAVNLFGNIGAPSDRNLKEQFTPVASRSVLDLVAGLPITRWRYKTDSQTPHIGPMAQDFYAAFSVGTDDEHISLLDEGGVALAAIQGLNQKLEDALKDKDAEIETLRTKAARVDSLEKRLNELEQTVRSLRDQ